MPTVVNFYTGSTGSFTTNHSVTITSVTAGNAVVLVFADGNQTPITNVLCGATSMSSLGSFPWSGGGENIQAYAVASLSGGQTTVTWTTGGNVIPVYWIFELSGATNTLDGTFSGTNNAFGTAASHNYTTSTASPFVFGLFLDPGFSASLSGVTAGFTTGSAAPYHYAYDNDVGTAGAKTLSGTWSAGTNGSVCVFALQAAATGGISLAWFTA